MRFFKLVLPIFLIITLLFTGCNFNQDSGGDNGNSGGTTDTDTLQLLVKDGESYVSAKLTEKDSFGEDVMWEPGKTEMRLMAIKNGSEEKKNFRIQLDVADDDKNLYSVLDYAFLQDAESVDQIWSAIEGKKDLSEDLSVVSDSFSVEAGATRYFAILIHMDESAGSEFIDARITINTLISELEASDEPVVYDTISFAEARDDFKAAPNEFKNYIIKVTVEAVVNSDTGVFQVSDGESSFKIDSIYGTDDKGGRVEYSDLEVKPKRGDELIVKANLKADQKGNYLVWRAVILLHTEFEVDDSTILEAREAEIGTIHTVKGVVAAVTYAFGQVPSGVILVDETASIYVYDKAVAEAVQVGNMITVSGSKAYWVLEDEQENAAKFGYKGSCQLESATLIENDGKTHGFDKSAIEETTVIDLLDASVTENITSKLYKVNALIREVPGDGFTNYYFFDIDGKTGTYAYTQCNGSDFAWLRAFDGKICTVYITPLNAKSTSSDCFYRFLPVAVIDEGYSFDLKDAPEYAVKYHGLTQLKSEYSGDPALELVTSVSSQLLGFDGVTISFSSSDESVVKFVVSGDKTTLTCPGFGKATVTVKATYEGYEYSDTIEVTVKENTAVDYISVNEAISAQESQVVTVKGIVGPSIVHANHRGFYLVDSTGAIAVSFLSSDTLKDIAIGNEVVIKGTRSTINGTQIAIENAELVSNFYGSNQIPGDTIVTDKNISQLSGIADTTVIYQVKGTPTFYDGQWADTYSISGIQLYSSNAVSQYKILADHVDKEITVLVTVVNWNGKGYKLCCVGVVGAEGTVYNEFSFGK